MATAGWTPEPGRCGARAGVSRQRPRRTCRPAQQGQSRGRGWQAVSRAGRVSAGYTDTRLALALALVSLHLPSWLLPLQTAE